MSSAVSNTKFAQHRDYSLIAKVEKDFFNGLLKKHGFFAGMNSSVETALANAAHFLHSKNDVHLEVLAEFDLSGSRDRVNVDCMYLGTCLVPSKVARDQQVTHFIALTKGDVCELKLHFDLDFHIEADEPKPSPHIQIGGRKLKISNGSEYKCKWETKLDKPRWPSLPFCTPLLWHAAFLEFQECESVKPFVNQSWWITLVKDAEKALWEPFARDIASSINEGRCLLRSLYPG